MLQTPLPAIDDREGDHVPESLPEVIDAHVHLFPDSLFESMFNVLICWVRPCMKFTDFVRNWTSH